MKKKLSLFLVILMALTMVMGIGVSAMAVPANPVKISEMRPGVSYTIPVEVINDTGECVYCLFLNSENKIFFLNSSSLDCPYIEPGNTGIIGAGHTGTACVEVNPFCSNSPSTSEPATPAHIHDFKWQTITEPTKDADGLEGEVCSCGAMRNTQPISAMAYVINEYATQMIKAAKPGQKITLEFGEFNSFPRYMMEKIAARMNENITFVFKFKQNKKMQTITIEPGTTIDLQYDWYGPDKMAELYGAN